MQKNKYYTPTIEELHVGFEYEAKAKGSTETSYSTFICHGHNSIFSEFNSSTIRVKYLDREDIESLGFVFKGGDTHLTYHYGGYAITHTPPSNKIDIYYYDGSEFVNGITIKNKSELKKLLKQLNINDNN